jgi:serine/threonine protein phosphatase 1
MSRIFAIGDIHGCNNTFKALVEKCAPEKTDKIYCLGDYIDRGPDSKAVIDHILSLREQGYTVYTLRGNHEQLMMDSVKEVRKYEHWLRNGGIETLSSFGISIYDEMPELYKNFFNETEFYIADGRFIFVHAGLNFQKSDIFEDKDAMLWIRDWKPSRGRLEGRLIIHGHTPRRRKFILEHQIHGTVNIDGGCVYPKESGLGNLVAYNATEDQFIFQENIENTAGITL